MDSEMMKLNCRVMRWCHKCPYDEIKMLQQKMYFLNRQIDDIVEERKRIEVLLSKQDISGLFGEPLCYYDGFTWKGGKKVQENKESGAFEILSQKYNGKCPFAFGSCEGRKALQQSNVKYLRRKLTKETENYNVLVQLLYHSLHAHQHNLGRLKDMYLSFNGQYGNLLVYLDKGKWYRSGKEGCEITAFIQGNCYDQIKEKKAVLYLETKSDLLEGTCCYLPKPYQTVRCVINNAFTLQEVLIMLYEINKLSGRLNKGKDAIDAVYIVIEEWPLEERKTLAAEAKNVGAKVIGRIEQECGFRENKILIKLCHKKE